LTHRFPNKPFICSIESGPKYNVAVHGLLASGVPCFRHADAAARAIAKVVQAMRREVL